MKKSYVLSASIIAILLAACYWYFFMKSKPNTEWTTERIERGDVLQSISATGSLAALTTVAVGCQITGIISSISVDFNDTVHEGQLIALIEPATFEAQMQQAIANLESAKASERNVLAQIENLKASLLTSKADQQVQAANLKKARVALTESERNYKRINELHARKLVSQSDLDSAETARDMQTAALDAAKAQLESAKAKELSVKAQLSATNAEWDGANARIRQMEAQLHVAKINLSRTQIFSPIDGVVISRNVDVGQTVAASLQAPTLFTIAQDLRKMQIDTAVDEADIGKVVEGQPVKFTVDAYKSRTFHGVVHQVRLSPVVSTNVVTYSAMVNVENDDQALKPGMTANVEIIVGERNQVLKVPTKAFFFIPPDIKQSTRNGKGARKSADSQNEGKLWLHDKPGRLRPVTVKMGLDDGQHTEIISDKINEGDMIVTGIQNSSQEAGSKSTGVIRFPPMGGMKRGR